MTRRRLRRRRVGAHRRRCSLRILAAVGAAADPSRPNDSSVTRDRSSPAADAGSPSALRASPRSGARSCVLTVVLSENVVYFRTVSEAVQRTQVRRRRTGSAWRARSCPAPCTRRRRACASRSPTARRRSRSTTDGDPPSLFKAGAPVVCEGRWSQRRQPSTSDRIMIRHGSEYKPPKVDAAMPRRPRDARREGVARGPRPRARRDACRARHRRARRSVCAATTSALLRLGRRYVFVIVVAAVIVAVGAMEWALLEPRLLAALRRREQRAGTPLLFTITGPVGRARGFDPAVAPDPRRLPRASPRTTSATARPTRSSRGRRSSVSSSPCSSSR